MYHWNSPPQIKTKNIEFNFNYNQLKIQHMIELNTIKSNDYLEIPTITSKIIEQISI